MHVITKPSALRLKINTKMPVTKGPSISFHCGPVTQKKKACSSSEEKALRDVPDIVIPMTEANVYEALQKANLSDVELVWDERKNNQKSDALLISLSLSPNEHHADDIQGFGYEEDLWRQYAEKYRLQLEKQKLTKKKIFVELKKPAMKTEEDEKEEILQAREQAKKERQTAMRMSDVNVEEEELTLELFGMR